MRGVATCCAVLQVRERGIKLQGRTFIHTTSDAPQTIDATFNRPLRATHGLQQHAYACLPISTVRQRQLQHAAHI